MLGFKTALDSAIKAKNHAISKSLLPKEAIAFIDSMLCAAISCYKSNESIAHYKMTCAYSLIQYFVKPSISA